MTNREIVRAATILLLQRMKKNFVCKRFKWLFYALDSRKFAQELLSELKACKTSAG